MALHVELRTAELVEQGVPPADARAAALRRVGNATLLREESRTMWGFGRRRFGGTSCGTNGVDAAPDSRAAPAIAVRSTTVNRASGALTPARSTS